MPKLNVQQNNANVIKAFKVALETSHRNLIDNWYFVGGGSQLGDGVFPINQRGQTSYSNGTNTTIDRWKTEASSISVDADGLTWTATGDNNQFEQIIENYKLIEGETYTATIDCDISAGSARLFVGGVSFPWPTVAGSAVNVSSGITSVTFAFARESGYTGQYKLALASVGSCTVKLRKFKLEKGTVSTLANDAPPNYAEELAKCNFYDTMLKTSAQYGYLGYGVADSATSATISIPLPNNMRDANPTITTNGTIAVKGGTSGTHTITGITFKLRVTGGVLVTVATTGLTTGEFCLLQLNNTSSYINLSADL